MKLFLLDMFLLIFLTLPTFRDRMVDKFILDVMRTRKHECITHWMPDGDFKCQKEIKDEMEAERNWQVKLVDKSLERDSVVFHVSSAWINTRT